MVKKFVLLLVAVILCLPSVFVFRAGAETVPENLSRRYTLTEGAKKLSESVTGKTSAAKTAMRLTPALTASILDISDKAFIYITIYISDEALLYNNTGDSIELCSGGSQDKEESSIPFYCNTASTVSVNEEYGILRTGWNEYLIARNDFTVERNGVLNAEALNFIGIVIRSQTAGLTVSVGEIYAVNDEDLENTLPDTDISEDKLPTGSLLYDFAGTTAPVDADGVLRLGATFNPVRVGDYRFLCVELYIENRAALSDNAALTISSSENDMVSQISFNPSSLTLHEGKNIVFIHTYDLHYSGYSYTDQRYGGVCDILGVVRFELKWSRLGENGNVRLGKVIATNSSTVVNLPDGRYTLKGNPINLTEGAVSEKVSASGTATLVRLIPEIAGGTVDISGKTHLYFWLYISDTSLDGSVSSEAFELSSGGTCDEHENSILLKALFKTYGTPKNGWNEYLIPISALTEITNKSGVAEDGCDFSSVNYLRVYFRTVADTGRYDVTYMLSTVYAVDTTDLEDSSGALTGEPITQNLFTGTSDSQASGKTEDTADRNTAQSSFIYSLPFAASTVLIILNHISKRKWRGL